MDMFKAMLVRIALVYRDNYARIMSMRPLI